MQLAQRFDVMEPNDLMCVVEHGSSLCPTYAANMIMIWFIYWLFPEDSPRIYSGDKGDIINMKPFQRFCVDK